MLVHVTSGNTHKCSNKLKQIKGVYNICKYIKHIYIYYAYTNK